MLFCFGDDVANGCQEGRHHLSSLMMLWALFVRLGDFREIGLDGWMFDGGEILVSCLMVEKGINPPVQKKQRTNKVNEFPPWDTNHKFKGRLFCGDHGKGVLLYREITG